MNNRVEQCSGLTGSPAEDRARVLPVLEEYMRRGGISIREMARRLDCSPETVKQFRSDSLQHWIAGPRVTYLCNAIEKHVRENPLGAVQELFGELYDTTNVRVIRDTIQRLLIRPSAYMIYGPPGSEKSFVIEHEFARLNQEEISKGGQRCAFYVYAEEQITPTQLMKEIAVSCGSGTVGDKTTIARNMEFDFRGRKALLAIDEAQHLSIPALESIRRLLDRPPYFSLLLAGSHDLRVKFDRFSAGLEQWNSRILDKVLLPGVTREEARGIIGREIGRHLTAIEAKKSVALIDTLIDAATVKDVFNGERPYINVRTLCNALEQYKYLQAKRTNRGVD